MFIFKYLEYIREFGLLTLLLDSFLILIFKNFLLQKISNTYKNRQMSTEFVLTHSQAYHLQFRYFSRSEI